MGHRKERDRVADDIMFGWESGAEDRQLALEEHLGYETSPRPRPEPIGASPLTRHLLDQDERKMDHLREIQRYERLSPSDTVPMTAGALIAKLSRLEPDTPVFIHRSGDVGPGATDSDRVAVHVGTWNMLPATGGCYVPYHHLGGVPVKVARLDVQSPFPIRSELDGR